MKPVRLVGAAALSALWLTACGNPSEDAADVEDAAVVDVDAADAQ